MPTRTKVFVDTNVFIYLFDKDESAKRKRCGDLLKELEQDQEIVISTQVIKEICAILIKKFDYPIPELKVFLGYLQHFEVVETNPAVIGRALDLMLTESLSFWDAVICASAEAANCKTLITEDLNHGQEIAGVSICNPFKK